MDRIFLIMIFFSNQLFAQTTNEMLLNANSAYALLGPYTAQVNYLYYADTAASLPIDSMTSNIVVKGDSFCIQYNNIDLLSDGNLLLQIDSINKLIVASYTQQSFDEKSISISHKWMKKVGKKLEKIGIANNQITLRYFEDISGQVQIEYIDFVLNTSTWLLTEMHMQYKNAPVIKNGAYMLANPLIVIQFANYAKFNGVFDELYGLSNWIEPSIVTNEIALKNSDFELIK